jgi:hypothetical protein
MVIEFKYTKKVDPEALHKQIANAGFLILGVSYDSGTDETTVMLDDAETKDPTDVVNAYVYVVPVYPNYPVLFSDAKQNVNDALTQYNGAVATYTTALGEWNAAGTTITSGNALVKLAACEHMVVATAAAISAEKDAIAALVQVVTVLAQRATITEE